MLTETPTAQALIEQIKAHHATGGGSALVKEIQTGYGRWLYKLVLYVPTGTGAMGEPCWQFQRNAAIGIVPSDWADVLAAKLGVASRGLHGVALTEAELARVKASTMGASDGR